MKIKRDQSTPQKLTLGDRKGTAHNPLSCYLDNKMLLTLLRLGLFTVYFQHTHRCATERLKTTVLGSDLTKSSEKNRKLHVVVTGNINTGSKLLFPVLSINNKETWELFLSTFLYLPYFKRTKNSHSDCIHCIWLHSAMNLLTLNLWFMLDVVAVNINVHLTTRGARFKMDKLDG